MQAVTYSRISPRPTEEDTIDVQERELTEFCGSQNWPVAGRFRDERISGSELNRPGLWKAIGSLQRGDVLVVRDLSRFARDIAVALALESELRDKGCYLATMENGIVLDPESDPIVYHDAILPRFVKYWSDARERLTKNARTSKRMLEHQAGGRCMGAVPYGKRREGAVLVDDEYEQRVIEAVKIARQMNGGASHRGIADGLTYAGYKSRSGNGFRHQLIKSILGE